MKTKETAWAERTKCSKGNTLSNQSNLSRAHVYRVQFPEHKGSSRPSACAIDQQKSPPTDYINFASYESPLRVTSRLSCQSKKGLLQFPSSPPSPRPKPPPNSPFPILPCPGFFGRGERRGGGSPRHRRFHHPPSPVAVPLSLRLLPDSHYSSSSSSPMHAEREEGPFFSFPVSLFQHRAMKRSGSKGERRKGTLAPPERGRGKRKGPLSFLS